MKFSKQLRFAALSVVCMSALASCIKDPVGGGLPDADLKATKLSISLPGIQNGMKTRAEVSQFDGITDVNIFITSGNNILHRLYITDFNTAGSEDDGGITYGPDTDEVVDYIVTYKASWLEAQDGVHRRGADNYIIVANYRYEITEGVADDVTALRELPIGRGGGGEVDTNQPVMYGESGVEVTLNADGTSGNKRVEMRRTAAMITLEINGSGLNSGVTITPVSVSLHNVPIGTYIGKENNVTNADATNSRKAGWVADNGDGYDLTNATVSSTNNVGKHYPMSNGGEYDYTDSEVKPLFMYENWHGENFGNTTATQINKRPANCASTDENTIESYSQACSYLEVKARFVDGSVHGEIVYRVFLGSDAISNFDVLRNHYYKVTLNLSGTGRQEGDASWRLDVDTSSIIISDSDFIINGGGEMIVIDVLDGGTSAAFKVEYEDGANPNWLYMMSTKSNAWMQLQDDSEVPITDDDHILLYASPMLRGLTWNGAGHVRQVRFRMRSANGVTSTPYMTVTQYEPVAIPLNQYSQFTSEIEALGWSTAGTLYIDRVDCEDPLPWGFDGTAIAAGIPDRGFTNGDNLMVNYGGAAANYLPQGKDGSAMMHAAFMRYYQRTGVPAGMYPFENPTIAIIQGYTPGGGLPFNFAIPSVEEWELIDMINQVDEIEFTEGQNIPAFIPYWTSTAVAGSDKAKTFNMTGILPREVKEIDRTTPTRYRMIHYRP